MNYYRLIVTAILAGAIVGTLAAMWLDFPRPAVPSPASSDPAAYEVSAVVEEARKILREAAGD